MSSEEPRIIPAVFTGVGEYGDFEMMIQDKKYADSLFIFNDNATYHRTARRGAGNAAIRPWNRYGEHHEYPRSAGIPTGYSTRSGGYLSLTPSAKKAIDESLDEIEQLIEDYKYCRVFFSADSQVHRTGYPQLGTAIFRIGDDVRDYITQAIYSLGWYRPDTTEE